MFYCDSATDVNDNASCTRTRYSTFNGDRRVGAPARVIPGTQNIHCSAAGVTGYTARQTLLRWTNAKSRLYALSNSTEKKIALTLLRNKQKEWTLINKLSSLIACWRQRQGCMYAIVYVTRSWTWLTAHCTTHNINSRTPTNVLACDCYSRRRRKRRRTLLLQAVDWFKVFFWNPSLF